jgi:hypothetical protein
MRLGLPTSFLATIAVLEALSGTSLAQAQHYVYEKVEITFHARANLRILTAMLP